MGYRKRLDFKTCLLGAALCLIAAHAPTSAERKNTIAQLRSDEISYRANIVKFAPLLGRDTVFDYDNRIQLDEVKLKQDVSAAWQSHFMTQANLDLSLMSQVLNGQFAHLAPLTPGLSEHFVTSSVDGTKQPYALYVPKTYRADRQASLVVMLHGNGEAESEFLAYDFLRHNADATNSILVAPWARNLYNYRGIAFNDIEDTVREVEAHCPIDHRRVYLVGYSMGGFSVYEIAARDPHRWRAIMSIAGSLLGEDVRPYMLAQKHTRLYILTGQNDEEIPTGFPTHTATYLSGKLLPVSFYSEPNGTHILATLQPIIDRAWADMFAGTVRAMGPVIDPADSIPPRR